MKRKIICIAILCTFLLTTVSVEANTSKTNVEETEDTATVSIHAFYDVNANGIQDSNERDADYFYVDITPNAPGYFLYFSTDSEGNCTLKVPDSWGCLYIMIHEKRYMALDDQYKASVGNVGPEGMPFYDGMHLEIPVKYVDDFSKSKTKCSIINNISNLLLILQRLLSL